MDIVANLHNNFYAAWNLGDLISCPREHAGQTLTFSRRSNTPLAAQARKRKATVNIFTHVRNRRRISGHFKMCVVVLKNK